MPPPLTDYGQTDKLSVVSSREGRVLAMALIERREAVLKIIIQSYIAVAKPIASKAVAGDYDLKVSPATIRNDMAYLEEEGYVTRPHPSAGAIPTDKAYRYYVESVSREAGISLAEQYLIAALCQEVEAAIEQRLRLAASLLADLVQNVAVVTQPRTSQCYFKHIDLVALHDFLALLILVLSEARVRQKILSLKTRSNQDELTSLATKLNSAYAEMNSDEISAAKVELSPQQKQVTACITDMMAAESKLGLGRPYLEGLHLMLSQPEFANSPRALNLLGLFEKTDWLESVCSPEPEQRGIRVIIGQENRDEAFQDLSLIIGEYGVKNGAKGIVGVIGPKRMDYTRAISSVDCLSSLLSESVAEYM